MKEPVITDSACLIALERIGQLELLPALFEPVLAPPEVQREFGSPLSWLQVQAPSDSNLLAALHLLVDSGEAEAIALAMELELPIVLDDLHARAVARRLGVKILGTLALLVRAKRAGLLPFIKPVVDELTAAGFRIGEALRQEALRLAGE